MNSAQKLLYKRLAEIDAQLSVMRSAARASSLNFYRHPDLITVLRQRNDVEIALKHLSILPTSRTSDDILLYNFRHRTEKAMKSSSETTIPIDELLKQAIIS